MKHIKKVSTKIRKRLDNRNKSRDRALYGKEYSLSLSGCCAIASVMLFEELSKLNISCKLALSENSDYDHVFVMIGNTVVDITATQFGNFKKVEIVDISADGNKKDFWEVSKVFDKPSELVAYQKQSGWSNDQIANLL